MSNLSNDAYGHTVTMTTDGTTDTYTVAGTQTFQFPAGTSQSVVYLSIAQQWNLQMFNTALTAMVNSHYTNETRLRWVQNWIESTVNGWTQRLAYINTLVNWGASITNYTATYIQTIMAMNDPSVVASTTWDFSAVEAADPQINLLTYAGKGTS
jgi:hypothetical protein